MKCRVGVAEVDYTPPVGLPLMGNFRKDYASRGVHDPLFAKAVVFENTAGSKAVLLALDVCMLDRKQVALMRGHIAAELKVPAQNIFIAATHIHSGPATISEYKMPKAGDKEIEAFLLKAARAAIEADGNLEDAELYAGYSREERLSFYRRIRCSDGNAHMNWENFAPGFAQGPLGKIDPQVSVLTVKRGGVSGAAIANFALHPAILDYGNDQYSAEYPGYLAEAMRKMYSPGFHTLFFNGCCGNINHLDYSDLDNPRRGYPAAERIGYMLAASVVEAVNGGTPARGNEISVSSEHVPLLRMEIDEESYRWARDALERLKQEPLQAEEDDGLPRKNCAETWIEMHDRQGSEYRAEVMVIRIGNIGIVGLPGEVFCEFGLEIKQKSPADHTFVIELANDAIGYLPTEEAFDWGGYEVTPGATLFRKDAGRKLTDSALNQLHRLFNASRSE